jgi:hypothetical protein
VFLDPFEASNGDTLTKEKFQKCDFKMHHAYMGVGQLFAINGCHPE